MRPCLRRPLEVLGVSFALAWIELAAFVADVRGRVRERREARERRENRVGWWREAAWAVMAGDEYVRRGAPCGRELLVRHLHLIGVLVGDWETWRAWQDVCGVDFTPVPTADIVAAWSEVA